MWSTVGFLSMKSVSIWSSSIVGVNVSLEISSLIFLYFYRKQWSDWFVLWYTSFVCRCNSHKSEYLYISINYLTVNLLSWSNRHFSQLTSTYPWCNSFFFLSFIYRHKEKRKFSVNRVSIFFEFSSDGDVF
jgi:hypothetical protein